MTDQDCRDTIARQWFQKAEDSFAEAVLLLREDRLVGCINRMYYSAFYAASAVIAKEGKTYGKHSAVRASLHRDFVKTNRLPQSSGKVYDKLFEDRQEGDYAPRTSFEREDVELLIGETRELLDSLKVLVD
ncbi:MAG: HEPN domain-containing protein [Chitinivibrionales bacterium]|nr:HEPN domain-containing protein [Chitinivibrionales bacterium]MBD3396307.1 HEPN domain-containing protein [Chitinivibrionales bacterium]